MLTVVLSELRLNARRTVSAGLAAVIAVAFVVATLGATQTMKAFLYQAIAARATLSDVVVVPAPGQGTPLPSQVRQRISSVPGVAHAEDVPTGYTQLRWADGDDVTAVAALPTDPRLRWMHSASGRLPAAPDEVAVDATTASQLGIHLGDVLTTTTDPAAAAHPLHVVGTVDLGPSPTFGGARTVVATAAGALAWGGAQVLEVDVLASPGTDTVALRDAVARVLPAGLVARTGPEQAAFLTADFTRGIDVLGGILAGFAAVAMLVAALVISNTFAILMAQRVRQLALLRCVGATRRQLFRSAVAEACVVGVVASAGGAVLGAVVVLAGVALLSALVPAVAGISASLPWWTLAVPFGVGVACCLLAALLPARRATRVAPLAALRPDSVAAARRAGRVRIVAGLVLGTAGAALLGLGLATDQVLVGIPGGLLSVLGVLLAGPVIVPAVARVLGRLGLGLIRLRLWPRRWRPTWLLAVGNAVRNPARASATSTALFVGVSLVTMMSVGAASASATADRQLTGSYPLDVAVSGRDGADLPASVVAAAMAVPGTLASAALHPAQVATPAGPVAVLTADTVALQRVWRGADGPAPGRAIVPYDLADQLGVTQASGRSTLVLGSGAHRLTLTVRLAHLAEPVLVTSDVVRLTGGAPGSAASSGVSSRVAQVWLRATDDVDAAGYRTDLRRAVQPVQGVQVDGSLVHRAEIADVLRILLWVVTGLLGVALLIAVVGVANTLALSVLERTRESGVQRALGMTRRQLRLSLGVEALLLSGVGSLLGVGLGIVYGWAAAATLLGGATDQVVLAVPWGRIVLVVLGSAAAALVASVLPARRATRVPPTVALAAL